MVKLTALFIVQLLCFNGAEGACSSSTLTHGTFMGTTGTTSTTGIKAGGNGLTGSKMSSFATKTFCKRACNQTANCVAFSVPPRAIGPSGCHVYTAVNVSALQTGVDNLYQCEVACTWDTPIRVTPDQAEMATVVVKRLFLTQDICAGHCMDNPELMPTGICDAYSYGTAGSLAVDKCFMYSGLNESKIIIGNYNLYKKNCSVITSSTTMTTRTMISTTTSTTTPTTTATTTSKTTPMTTTTSTTTPTTTSTTTPMTTTTSTTTPTTTSTPTPMTTTTRTTTPITTSTTTPMTTSTTTPTTTRTTTPIATSTTTPMTTSTTTPTTTSTTTPTTTTMATSTTTRTTTPTTTSTTTPTTTRTTTPTTTSTTTMTTPTTTTNTTTPMTTSTTTTSSTTVTTASTTTMDPNAVCSWVLYSGVHPMTDGLATESVKLNSVSLAMCKKYCMKNLLLVSGNCEAYSYVTNETPALNHCYFYSGVDMSRVIIGSGTYDFVIKICIATTVTRASTSTTTTEDSTTVTTPSTTTNDSNGICSWTLYSSVDPLTAGLATVRARVYTTADKWCKHMCKYSMWGYTNLNISGNCEAYSYGTHQNSTLNWCYLYRGVNMSKVLIGSGTYDFVIKKCIDLCSWTIYQGINPFTPGLALRRFAAEHTESRDMCKQQCRHNEFHNGMPFKCEAYGYYTNHPTNYVRCYIFNGVDMSKVVQGSDTSGYGFVFVTKKCDTTTAPPTTTSTTETMVTTPPAIIMTTP